MNRGEGECLEHDHPALAGRQRRQLLERERDESWAQVGWHQRASLGRLRGQLERGDDATDFHRGAKVFGPVLHLFALATLERCAQPVALLVERRILEQRRVVRLRDDRAQVAQVDGVDDLLDGIHVVAPLGDAQAGQHLDDEVDQRVGVDLGLAVLLQLLVLVVHGFANGTDAAFERLLGQHALFGLQRLEHGRAMRVARAQASSAWTLGQLGRGRRELASRCSRAATAGVTLASLATVATTTLAAATGFVARRSVALVGGDLRDGFEVGTRAGDGEQRDVAFALGDRCDGGDDRAVHVEFDVGTQHVADLAAVGQQTGCTRTLRGLGTGLTPGEGAVRARAGDLNVNATRHG